jgi:hypothetical protein
MHRSRLFWAILGAAGALHLAPAQLYDFNVVAPPSGISGNLAISARTQGTLVGNYDPDTNPNGTRTKPGLFGSFDPTENVPVEVRIGAAIGGEHQPSGGRNLPRDGRRRQQHHHLREPVAELPRERSRRTARVDYFGRSVVPHAQPKLHLHPALAGDYLADWHGEPEPVHGGADRRRRGRADPDGCGHLRLHSGRRRRAHHRRRPAGQPAGADHPVRAAAAGAGRRARQLGG